MQTVKEGKAEVFVHLSKVVSKDLPVFYNPVMKFNRDVTVALFNSLGEKKMRVLDLLAGSGVRSVRLLKEVPKTVFESLHINDYGKDAVKLIKKNLKHNKITDKRVIVTNEEANKLLINSEGYDYIDIDPFGSPNQFLDQSVQRLAREGVLAVTATDTAPLCGTYPQAGKRKYWAEPKKCSVMHELGLRILIRKVQLIGAQYDKALTPVYSYSKDHYFRIFFKCKKGKQAVDQILEQHEMLNDAGPLWIGPLWDATLAKKISTQTQKMKLDTESTNYTKWIAQESTVDSACFVDIHELSSKLKLKSVPKREDVITTLEKQKHSASPTHFKGEGIRTNISREKLIKILERFK